MAAPSLWLASVGLLLNTLLLVQGVPLGGATKDEAKRVVTALVAPAVKFGGDHEAHAPSGFGRPDAEVSALSTKAPAGAAVARRMNERFNNEKLEHINDMVIIHQWDGWEHPEAKWKQCPEPKNLTGDLVWSVCAQAGAIAPRRPRVSSAIIHAGMQKRIGKEHGVPLFSYEGGIALKPSKNVVA